VNQSKLQKKWDKILLAEGMPPELSNSEAHKATNGISDDLGHETRQVRHQALQEYYRLGGQFLWDREWNSKLDRAVWELHVEGVSYRGAKAFKRFKSLMNERLGRRVPVNESRLRKIINKYALEMKAFYGI
jgi:hypothetical protein